MLSGRPATPPLFALGYHQSKYGYKTETEVMGVIKNLTSHKIPHDVIWLDIDHLRGRGPFEFNNVTFPTPEEIYKIQEEGHRYVVRICDCHLPNWPDHIQYQQAKAGRYFVRLSNGIDDYTGHAWPGTCSWPDFMNETVNQWYSKKYYYHDSRDIMAPHVFIWNDVNEWDCGKNLRATNGMEQRELLATYGMFQSAATYRGMIERNNSPNRRGFVLTRSFYIGNQRYAWTWTGDNTATWDQFNRSLTMMLNLGLVSMPFAGQDCPGNAGNPPPEMTVRWMQVATWTWPFLRSHSSEGPWREPWNYAEPLRSQVMKILRDRYSLIGQWYSSSVMAVRQGGGPVVPLWFEWPEISEFHDNEHMGLFGGSLLVEPVFEANATSKYIVKPPGYWYDLYSGEFLNESGNRNVRIDDVPVYIRGGRIIGLYKKSGLTTFSTIVSPMTLIIGGDDNRRASGFIYLDDGVSYDYEVGKFLHRNFTFGNGIVKCSKGDPNEKEVPEFLRSAIISGIDLYYIRPDGEQVVDRFMGLNLKLSEEWEWSVA
jgi:alpha 1,3-glucosidase